MVTKSNNLQCNPSVLLGIILLTLCGFFGVSPAISEAAQASFTWDPNPEPDIGGYRIFCRERNQSYNYESPSWEGAETEGTAYDLDDGKVYCCVVRAFDTDGFESDDSNEACYETSGIVNHPPSADAGPDQLVEEGQSVLLNGSNSIDDDDGIASYQWVQTGGPEVALSDPDAVQPNFSAPDVGVDGAALTFMLTVTDIAGNQGQDACVVNVTWQNEPPQANAGPDQTVNEGEAVTLDGTSSLDIDDGIVAYEWVQIGYPTIILSNSSTPSPTFTAPPVGPDGLSLTFSLTVTDAGGLQHSDSCIVNVTWQNEPPTAIITPDYLETTGTSIVNLDGSASTDPDDGIASYLWTQVEGDPITFSNPTLAVTSFTAPATEVSDKNIRVRLTVTDNGGLKDTADSSIYIMQNEPPTLNSVTISGPAQVLENSGAQYMLIATYSDGSSTQVTNSAGWNQNFSHASIGGNGYLTAGSVTSSQTILITASYEGKSDTYIVTIEDVPPTLTSVRISGPAQVLENSGAQYALTASYSDGSHTEVTDIATWSENSSYASINNGLFIASSVASNQFCILTASYEGKSDTYNVTIKDVPPTLTSVTIGGPAQVNENSGAQYVLTASYSDGSTIQVTNSAGWSQNSSHAAIDTHGYLTAGLVPSDQTLVITANFEGMTATLQVAIVDVPTNLAPEADFSYYKFWRFIGYNDRSIDKDGTIVSWHWDFGDGTASTKQNPWHRYAQYGDYAVTLTVIDDEGAIVSITKTVSFKRR